MRKTLETATAVALPRPARCLHIGLVWLWCSTFLLLARIPTSRGGEIKHYLFQPTSPEPLASDECPSSCSNLFGKLEEGSNNGGRRVQTVHVQERGEPKSGTGFMFEWAMGAIAYACMYLQSAYGEQSCWIEWSFFNRTLVFEPDRAAASPGPCSCDDVEMVVIFLTNDDKHTLPVEDSCGYSHAKGIGHANGPVCTPPGGGDQKLENFIDLYQCAQDSACHIVDDRLQMSVMRDPRAVAVSSYFHALRTYPELLKGASLDEYVLQVLPTYSKWVTIRYFLFAEVLAERSTLFWYDDAQDSPAFWHDAFYDLVGLRVPASERSKAVDYSVSRAPENRFAHFPTRGEEKDIHLGQEGLSASNRTFRDEVTPETLLEMDATLTLWLPPVLLRKFRVGSV